MSLPLELGAFRWPERMALGVGLELAWSGQMERQFISIQPQFSLNSAQFIWPSLASETLTTIISANRKTGRPLAVGKLRAGQPNTFISARLAALLLSSAGKLAQWMDSPLAYWALFCKSFALIPLRATFTYCEISN